MPRTSEKIRLANTPYDRRVKLSFEQREEIRYIREKLGWSYNTLAKKYGVSKRLIQFVCNPEMEERARENFKILKKMEDTTTAKGTMRLSKTCDFGRRNCIKKVL